MANHYIRTDEAGTIVYGFTDAFEQPLETDILILEDGPRGFIEAWPESLVNERFQYRFKWVDGERVERTQVELDAEWSARPPEPPSLQDRLQAAEELLLTMMLGG